MGLLSSNVNASVMGTPAEVVLKKLAQLKKLPSKSRIIAILTAFQS